MLNFVLLQQQIQNGPPSFTRRVNNNGTGVATNGTSGNGTGAAGNLTQLHNKRRRPALIALTVNNKNSIKRRPPKRQNSKFQKVKLKPLKNRKPRDVQDESENEMVIYNEYLKNYKSVIFYKTLLIGNGSKLSKLML